MRSRRPLSSDELTRERKAFSTIDNHRLLFKRYIEPRWGHLRLGAIRTVEVEEWLHSLPLAPASKAKLKCVMAVLYNHAIRHEWLTFNPISRVRTSQKRLRDRDVLAPEEFQELVHNSPCATGPWFCSLAALVFDVPK
jgi:site-specific recombinase XerD